jgi:hypothetical protein
LFLFFSFCFLFFVVFFFLVSFHCYNSKQFNYCVISIIYKKVGFFLPNLFSSKARASEHGYIR